jgi:dipeptidase
VALGRVTVDGHTLFAQNSDARPDACQVLQSVPAHEHALGEKVPLHGLELPQARQTFTVLGSQPVGAWGFQHGVNEHRLAIGCGSLRTRLSTERPTLSGCDLVRLALERTRQATRAVEFILDLVERHGQRDADGGDASFLIADPSEAFLVETAGSHWVLQEIGQVRAVSDLSTIHQDWVRIGRGLAGRAIEHGWWPADGSKLNFAEAIAPDPIGRDSALRRWGRATYLLEQQSGHIDACFLRRLLSDHYEGMRDESDPQGAGAGPYPLCQHGPARATVASMVAPLVADEHTPALAWCCFGPPCLGVYFPVFLAAELPAPLCTGGAQATHDSLWWRTQQLTQHLRSNPDQAAEVCAAFDRLQARFDQEAEELIAAGQKAPKERPSEWQRQVSALLQHCVERYQEALNRLVQTEAALAAVWG